MNGAIRTFLFLSVGLAAVGAGRVVAAPPLPGDRAAISMAGTWTSVRLLDEVDAPVRWTGDGAGWSLAAELPVRRAVLRAGAAFSRLPLNLDAQGGARVEPADYATDSRFREHVLEVLDVGVDARWCVGRRSGWRFDAGVFLRGRVEALGPGDWNESTGYGGVRFGPVLRVGWRPTPGLDVAGSVAMPIGGWYLRSPYLGYNWDSDWLRHVRFAAFPDFGEAHADLTARVAIGRRAALEGTGGLDYAWTELSRRYRALAAQARLGLVIGL